MILQKREAESHFAVHEECLHVLQVKWTGSIDFAARVPSEVRTKCPATRVCGASEGADEDSLIAGHRVQCCLYLMRFR